MFSHMQLSIKKNYGIKDRNAIVGHINLRAWEIHQAFFPFETEGYPVPVKIQNW